jgi:hypothetical protein
VRVPPETWRKALVRRAHIENPDLYTDEEKKEYADAVDSQLERAVDLLEAIRVFESR